MLERMIPGGQIYNTDRIENYPGIIRVDGPSLIDQMQKQVESFGAEIKTGAEVTDIEKLPDGRVEVHCHKDRYQARAVVIWPWAAAIASWAFPARTSSATPGRASAIAARAMPRSSATRKWSRSAAAIPRSRRPCTCSSTSRR